MSHSSMNYSFALRAATSAAASDAVAVKLGEVVGQQPAHDADRTLVANTVESVLDLLGSPPEGHELSISVHGSCAKRDGAFGSISIGVDAVHVAIQG